MPITFKNWASSLFFPTLILILCLPPEIYPSVRLISFLVAGLSLFGLLVTGTQRDKKDRLLPFIGLSFAAVAISTFGTVSPGRTLDGLGLWIFFIFIYLCARQGLPAKGFDLSLLILVTFHVSWALLQKLVLFRLHLDRLSEYALSDPVVAAIRLESGRVFSTFMLPSHLGLFLGMAVIFLMSIARKRKGPIRLWALILVPFALLVLGLTLSYASIAALSVGLVFLILLDPAGGAARKKVLRLSAFLGVVFIIILIIWLSRTSPLLKPGEHSSSLLMRANNMKRASEMITDRPVVGFGYRTFGIVYPAYMEKGDNPTEYAHNSFLQMGAETGIFGLAALIFLALVGLVIAHSRWSRGKENSSSYRCVFFALTVFWTHNLFDFGLYLPSLSGFAFFLMGSLHAKEPIALDRTRRISRGLILVSILFFILGAWITGRVSLARIAHEQALQSFHDNDRGSAITHASRAVDYWPYEGRYQSERAAFYLHQSTPSDLDRARAGFEEAVRFAPTFASARYGLGMTLLSQGKVFAAYHELSMARDLYPIQTTYQDAVTAIEEKLPVIEAGEDER
ncbi:O-antigen ligase family protein [Acidobacteriota bacterium]